MGLRKSFWQIAWLDRPSAIRPRTSRSRAQPPDWAVVAATAEQLRDHLGIDGCPAAPDAPNRVDEVVDLDHTVPEEIAEAAARLLEQPERSPCLHDLRQEQDADVGALGTKALRLTHALVGLRGRHPHVEDDDVGPLEVDRGSQALGVADLRHDLEAGLGEHAGKPFPHQHGVVGERHPHRTIVTHGARCFQQRIGG